MVSKLSAYKAKRDPAKTPEPMGAKKQPSRSKATNAPTFVIQEHHARSLHWDFRLERDGVLVSWALPKGLPENPSTNHLAVHTEDHPLDYADFEGEIPKGEYGGGQVKIWDRGTYDLEKWSDKEVKVVLHGEHVSGRYVLFATGGKNWMIHRMDPPADNYEPMPERIRPMLAQPGSLPKSDDGWAYEFKWDGVRAIVHVDGGRIRAYSRNDKDFAVWFPELRAIGEFLGARSAILDGEIVSLNEEGRPDFGRIAHRLHITSKSMITRRAKEAPATFFAFDLVYLEGRVLMGLPYDERRKMLESLELNGDGFATPPSIVNASGKDLFDIARERGLEGVVIKRRDSPYRPGQRSGEWVKVKNFRTQEVVIGGWTEGKGERAGSLGALLLGLPADDGLSYVGKVGTGFSTTEREDLLKEIVPLEQDKSPFIQRLSPSETAAARFVRPELVGEVRYSEWTSDGRLRHPSWRGLRPDKDPSEVVREP